MIRGFSTDVAILLGPGYSREDLKSLRAADDEAGSSVIAGKSVYTIGGLAAEIVRASEAFPPRPATALLRQEYLRLLFSHPRTAGNFPALLALRPQPGFWRKVSDAMAEARLTSVHEQERAVHLERLQAAGLGAAPVREEVLALSSLWREWLHESGRLDECEWLHQASQILSASGLPESGDLGHIRRIDLYSHAPLQGLELHFIEELGRRVEVRTAPLIAPTDGDPGGGFERWHTVEDAAESLGDLLCSRIENGVPHSSLIILIPDGAASGTPVRRALSRVLAERNISELDARDPLETRISEEVRHAWMGPLLASCGFERLRLLEWLRAEVGIEAGDLGRIHSALSDAGAREGWRQVQRLLPEHARTRLEGLEAAARGSIGLEALHELFEREPGTRVSSRIREWVRSVLGALREDLEALGLQGLELRLSEWMERVRARAEQSPAPARRIRPRTGVRIVRFSQFNAGFRGMEVFALGLPARWLSESRSGDLYLGARDREILGTEFAIHSSHSARSARTGAFSSWMAAAAPGAYHLLDYQHEMDGSERERIEPLLAELGIVRESVEMGAHPRNMAGYSIVADARPREVRLSPMAPAESGRFELSASDIEAYSRCPFTALVRSRWRIRSPDEPDLSPWPSTRGQLLHAAVECLVRGIESNAASVRADAMGASRRALESAWIGMEARGGLKGWVPTPQLRIQVERQVVQLLCLFLEKEWEYRDRSGVRLLAAEEDAKLEWSFAHEGREYCIRGKADRIDAHADGLWVIDYKSGGQALKGGDMRERGYRLQLAYYAIAAAGKFDRPVLGAQLVELTREAKRSVGFFPKKWNGSKEGCLTRAAASNSSLFDGPPEELWSTLEDRIRTASVSLASGIADASPVLGASECRDCRVRSACGQARREWLEGE